MLATIENMQSYYRPGERDAVLGERPATPVERTDEEGQAHDER